MKAGFMGEGVVLQPGQQAIGRRTNHIGLRVMDMHIHKTRRNQIARQVHDFCAHLAHVFGLQCLPATGSHHPLLALCIRGNGQQTIAVIQRRSIVGKAEQGAAVDLHRHDGGAMEKYKGAACACSSLLSRTNHAKSKVWRALSAPYFQYGGGHCLSVPPRAYFVLPITPSTNQSICSNCASLSACPLRMRSWPWLSRISACLVWKGCNLPAAISF